MNPKGWAVVLVALVTVPWAVVLLIAFVRGYDLDVHMHRKVRTYTETEEEGQPDGDTDPG